jgi:hypothetical protein
VPSREKLISKDLFFPEIGQRIILNRPKVVQMLELAVTIVLA